MVPVDKTNNTITKENTMEMEKFNMPLLGDEFPSMSVATTHGPMNIPADLKGSWFVQLFSHPADFTRFAQLSSSDCEKDGRV